jgi:hypothetical protein
MHNINSVTTISTTDDFDEDNVITIDTSQLTSAYVSTTSIGPSSITVDDHAPLIIRDENGESHDVAKDLKEIKDYIAVLEQAVDTLLADARKDTSIAEMLDKHEFLRKLSE